MQKCIYGPLNYIFYRKLDLCVDFEILQHLNLSIFQYTDFFLAWNLKMTLLDSV